MDSETSGLHYEPSGDDALDTLRQQAQSLSHNLQIDMGRTRAFATPLTGAAEMTDGLLTEDDPEALAEQLRELRAREADLRLRRLLERAERAADRGDHPAALSLLNEALGLDRTSASAWLLKGRCLIAIGDFAQATQVIAVAQRHARDAHGTKLAARLRATCEREELREFAAELTDLIDQGRLAEASQRVQERLRDQPDHPILLQNWCALLVLSDSVEAARSVAENALRVVDRSSAGRFEELLRHIAQRECEPRIRDARLALRRGDTGTALARLDECTGAIGDSEHFVALRSYALERHNRRGPLAKVRRLRRRRDDAGPIDRDTFQWLIEWLVQEELNAGWAALQAGDYLGAQEQFEAAEAIDDRCALAAFLHAAALFRGLIEHLEKNREPSLEHAHEVLVRAGGLTAQCADDATVGARSQQLGETIRYSLVTVKAVQAKVARTQAVNRCVSRFNSLVQHYERVPIRTLDQRDTARRSFDALAQEVLRLRRGGSTEPREVDVLKDLANGLTNVQRQLFGR
ncbi:MAG: tetratricopeptide repeat protein [Actinobacteria bacterium]|nr:tetratricopeptide repeat protein [Actinomycetota bacterium]